MMTPKGGSLVTNQPSSRRPIWLLTCAALSACHHGNLNGPLAFDVGSEGFTSSGNAYAPTFPVQTVGVLLIPADTGCATDHPGSGTALQINLYGGDGGVQAGTWPLKDVLETGSATIYYFNQAVEIANSVSGSVNVVSLTSDRIQGSFVSQMRIWDGGDSQLSGDFDAPFCGYN